MIDGSDILYHKRSFTYNVISTAKGTAGIHLSYDS